MRGGIHWDLSQGGGFIVMANNAVMLEGWASLFGAGELGGLCLVAWLGR